MLFDNKKRVKGIESFNPELCEVEKEKRDEVRAISIGRLSYEKNFLTSVRA